MKADAGEGDAADVAHRGRTSRTCASKGRLGKMAAMTDPLLAGIDLGTTTSKAVVVTSDGIERSSGVRATPWERVQTGAEAAPEALLAAALDALGDALAGAPDGRVVGLGVTSMAETGVLLDVGGAPLLPAVAWHDQRAAAEGEAMAADLGTEEMARRTGLKPASKLTAATYRWLARHERQAERGATWLSVAEWVVHALGGQAAAEASLAARTGWLDIERRSWWPDAVEWSGMNLGWLPEIRQAGDRFGAVRGERIADPALAAGIDGAVLTVAGHDHQAAAIGVGVVDPQDVLNSCGTAEAFVRATLPLDAAMRARVVASGLSVGVHVLPGHMVLIGGFRSGDRLQALLDVLGIEDRDPLDATAAAVDEALPAIGLQDLDRLTMLERLRLDAPTSARLWRTAADTVARHGAEVLARIEALTGPRRRLVVVGGWGQTGQLAEAKEALLGPVERPNVGEAGARGAALLAGVAAGVYPDAAGVPPPVHTAAAP